MPLLFCLFVCFFCFGTTPCDAQGIFLPLCSQITWMVSGVQGPFGVPGTELGSGCSQGKRPTCCIIAPASSLYFLMHSIFTCHLGESSFFFCISYKALKCFICIETSSSLTSFTHQPFKCHSSAMTLALSCLNFP